MTGHILERSYSKSDVDGRTDTFGLKPFQAYEVTVKAVGGTIIE